VESRIREAAKLGIKWSVRDGFNVGWEAVDTWMKEAREEWKGLVPESYDGRLSDVDMNEAWHLLTHRRMTKEQFQDWLDQRVWDKADQVLEEVEAGEEIEREEEDPAEIAKKWARFMRRQARGESFADMLPLDLESEVGEEEEEEEVHYDPTPTSDLGETLRAFRASWRSPAPSSEEGEVTYVPHMDLNQFDPILTGNPTEDHRRVIEANSRFKGLLD
jgi:hypothetical protein